MKEYISNGNDCFESLLSYKSIDEFADGMLALKENRGDFILKDFHGVTLTTEGCNTIEEFKVNNEEAIMKLYKNLQTINIGEYLANYIKGIIDLKIDSNGSLEFDVTNIKDSFDVRIKNINKRIKELDKQNDIVSLSLSGKEEKAKVAVENAIGLPSINSFQEAINIVDALENSDTKTILSNTLIDFIINNSNDIEEKDEINKIIDSHPDNHELYDLKMELKSIKNEKNERIKIKNRFLEEFKRCSRQKNKSNNNIKENNQPEPLKSEINESQPAVVEEKESNEEYFSRLSSIANDGPIFQDLDLTVGYSYGAYKAVAAKKDEIKAQQDQEEFEKLIPALNETTPEFFKNAKRKIVSINKASVALIEKVRSIDFKSKINAGLERIKAFGAKIAEYADNVADKVNEYADGLADKYYDKKLEYATAKVEKYSKMENDMNDLIAARGLSR